MNTKNVILATAIATVLLVAAVGGASAGCVNLTAGVNYGCGNTVMHSCVFDADIVCSGQPANQPGLSVGASGITIDGDGYAIIGNRSAPNACNDGIVQGGAPPTDNNPALHSGIANAGGVSNNYNNVVIKDLKIKDFCTGIALGDVLNRDVDYNDVINCTIYDCGDLTQSTQGIHMYHTNNNTITENTIYHIDGSGHSSGCSGGGNGIFMYGDVQTEKGWYNNFTHNNLSYNTKSGYFMKHMCEHNNISYNNASGNDQGGITLRCMESNNNDIRHNNATGNGIWGIYIGGADNTVWNNTANNTGNGRLGEGTGICICRDSAENNSVRNNTACENDADGIRIVRMVVHIGNRLYDNTFCLNKQNDINNEDPYTTGDYNMCDTAIDYCDIHATCPPPCVYQCPAPWDADLVISEKTETWFSGYTNYTIDYKICNRGRGVASNVSWTGVYINDVFNGSDQVGVLAPLACTPTMTVGPFDSYGPNDTIRLWADYTELTDERSWEGNNNRTNVFGGADLVIEDYDHEWVDLSWKTYNVYYTVNNTGDRPTPVDAWVNFTDNNGDDWKDCVDPDKVDAGLGIGETLVRTRTFVMGDGNDWFQTWVNFNHTCPVKEWNVLQHDYDRRHAEYPEDGPCWGDNGLIAKCGDVNLDCEVDPSGDLVRLAQHLEVGTALDCYWAANVLCDNEVDPSGDLVRLAQHLEVGTPLNCCEGCELWP